MQTALITTLLVVSSASCAWAGPPAYYYWLPDSTQIFGMRIQQKLSNEPNLAIASLGLHSILSLTLRGARGYTESELLALLNWQRYTSDDLFYVYANVYYTMTSGENDIINAILVGQNISIDPRILEEAKKFYQALVISGDPKNPEKAETEINEFVANRTNGNIQSIIPRGSVTDASSLVLSSSLNYQKSWLLRFDPSKTQKQSFYKSDGTIIQVDMIKDTRVILYNKDNRLGVDIVRIPLNDAQNEILLVIPHQINGLSELENILSDHSELRRLYYGLGHEMVELTLPKFKIETKLDLTDTLKQLGVVNAFTPNMADFGGFETHAGRGTPGWRYPLPTSFHNLSAANVGSRNPMVLESTLPTSPDNLHISNVYHSVTLEINESGLNTVSSPDTQVQVTPSMVSNYDSALVPIRVVADRPFLFFIGKFNYEYFIKIQGRFSGF